MRATSGGLAAGLSVIACLALAPVASAQPAAKTAASVTAFVPAGQVVVQEIVGDLNKDGLPDRVLLIKGTDQARVVTDRDRGRLDRNRRGLVIAFGAPGGWTLALSHRDCFASENEDGGVYYAPELDLAIQKGTLQIAYRHGRYGYWSYTFRHRNGDFELIGFDSAEHRGPVVLREVSVNFATRKMRIRTNPNPASEDDEVRLKERWKTFAVTEPVRLRDVADFDAFDPVRALEGTGR